MTHYELGAALSVALITASAPIAAQELRVADFHTFGSTATDFAVGIAGTNDPDVLTFSGVMQGPGTLSGPEAMSWSLGGPGGDAFVADYMIGSGLVFNVFTVTGPSTHAAPRLERASSGTLVLAASAAGDTFFSPVASGPTTATTTLTEDAMMIRTSDPYMAMLDASNAQLWVDLPAGSLSDFAKFPRELPSGDILFGGLTRGNLAFNPGLPSELFLPRASDASFDSFIARYSPDGTIQWFRQIGGLDIESIEGLELVDGEGFVAAGYYLGELRLNEGLADEVLYNSRGLEDIFVARWNAAAELQWSIDFGGEFIDRGYGLAVLPDGDLIITGSYSEGCEFVDVQDGVIIPGIDMDLDIFVARLDGGSGKVRWLKTITGPGFDERPDSIELTTSGRTVFLGLRHDGPVWMDGQLLAAGTSDSDALLLSLYAASGEPRNSLSISGTGIDAIYGLHWQEPGRLAATGFLGQSYTISDDIGPITGTTLGGNDGYFMILDAGEAMLGAESWARYR